MATVGQIGEIVIRDCLIPLSQDAFVKQCLGTVLGLSIGIPILFPERLANIAKNITNVWNVACNLRSANMSMSEIEYLQKMCYEFRFPRQMLSYVTVSKGLADLAPVESALKNGRYDVVEFALLMEKNNSRKVEWLRLEEQRKHGPLLYELAAAELIEKTDMETLRNISTPLLTTAFCRELLDAKCFGKDLTALLQARYDFYVKTLEDILVRISEGPIQGELAKTYFRNLRSENSSVSKNKLEVFEFMLPLLEKYHDVVSLPSPEWLKLFIKEPLLMGYSSIREDVFKQYLSHWKNMKNELIKDMKAEQDAKLILAQLRDREKELMSTKPASVDIVITSSERAVGTKDESNSTKPCDHPGRNEEKESGIALRFQKKATVKGRGCRGMGFRYFKPRAATATAVLHWAKKRVTAAAAEHI